MAETPAPGKYHDWQISDYGIGSAPEAHPPMAETPAPGISSRDF